MYLNPPQSKVLKDERGQSCIQEFQKFCKSSSDLAGRTPVQLSFVHFLAYFYKSPSLDSLCAYNSFPKHRVVAHYLCLHGHLHLLHSLLRSCPLIDINQVDLDGTTPLILAFKNKQIKTIDYLLKYPILNLNKGSDKYGFPLHIGIKNHEFKLVRKLLAPRKFIVNINVKDSEGNNALHYIMGHFNYDLKNSISIAKTLLRRGIEVNGLNKSELAPLHMAIKSFQSKALKFAFQYNHYIKNKNHDRDAANLLENTFDFNQVGKNKWTPLHYAVHSNNLSAVELLLSFLVSEHINVFARDFEGKLPQELCPFNSPIYKMIIRRQHQLIRTKNIEHIHQKEQIQLIHHQVLNKNFMNKQYHQANLKHDLAFTKESGVLKRINSNGLLFSKIHEELDFDRKPRVKIQEAYLEKNQREEIRKSIIEGQSRIMQKSENTRFNRLKSCKTEKNLHTNSMLVSNFTNGQESPMYEVKYENKHKEFGASPRMIQCLKPISPKQLIGTEDDVNDNIENFNSETVNYKIIKSRSPRYFSNPINFESDQDQDKIYDSLSESQSDNELLTDEKSDEDSDISLKSIIIQINSNDRFNRTSQFNQSPHKRHLVNSKSIDNSYMSMPTKDLVKPIKDEPLIQSGEGTVNQSPKAFVQDKRKSNLRHENQCEDEEDDNCEAVDEDAEAGSLGLIANKINKFENHNYDVSKEVINEKEALKRFLLDVQVLRTRYGHHKKQDSMSQYQRIDHSSDTPFDCYNQLSSSVVVQEIDDEEGNVFDTLDNRRVSSQMESLFIDDPIPQYLEAEKFSARVIGRANIFVNPNAFTPSTENQMPFSRKSIGGASITNMRMNHQASQGALCRLMDLNKDCKLFDTLTTKQTQISVQECLNFLSDIDLALYKKYELFFTFISQNGIQAIDSRLKQLYDKLQDKLELSMFTSELSYLMSLRKNKEFIPLLDNAIKKMQSDVKPIKKGKPQLQQKAKQANHTQQRLLLYETQNAFEILMNDALQTTKQMMEQINQKIYMERERSREKLKTAHSKILSASNSALDLSASGFINDLSNIKVQMFHKKNPQQFQVFNAKQGIKNNNTSILDMPSMIIRMSKSPSAQSLTQLRKYANAITNGLSTSNVNESMLSSGQGDLSGQNSARIQYKKAAFTPKGSTGQVFLAFQRQKQHQQMIKEIMLMDPQSPIRDYETQAVPHYKINLNADDEKSDSSYKQNFESFQSINNQFVQKPSYSQINHASSKQNNQIKKSNDLQQMQKNLQRPLRQEDEQSFEIMEKDKLKNVKQTLPSRSFFNTKQRELSQQIKNNLQSREQAITGSSFKQDQGISNQSRKGQSQYRIGESLHKKVTYILSKMSPTKMHDASLAKIEENKKVKHQNNQYQKYQLQKPKQSEASSYRNKTSNKKQSQNIRVIKANVSMESVKQSKSVKKSTSTSKLTSDTTMGNVANHV